MHHRCISCSCNAKNLMRKKNIILLHRWRRCTRMRESPSSIVRRRWWCPFETQGGPAPPGAVGARAWPAVKDAASGASEGPVAPGASRVRFPYAARPWTRPRAGLGLFRFVRVMLLWISFHFVDKAYHKLAHAPIATSAWSPVPVSRHRPVLPISSQPVLSGQAKHRPLPEQKLDPKKHTPCAPSKGVQGGSSPF